MVPIYQDIGRTQLIADKRRLGSANLFGIIAYTDANPSIKKLLRDNDYWDCFDSLSCGWIIYAIRPEYGKRVSCFAMTGADKKPQFEFNYDFLADFGIDSNEHFPTLIVCALAEDNRIEAIRVPIDDSSVDIAGKNLRQVISDITRVLLEIDDNNKSSKNVLREVERELASLKVKTSFNKASKAFIQFLTSVISF